ncbi:MAG: sulfotransferase [Bacteroidales bacterium]|nr:sulfotransferase [Bacteroidales bacterium]
MTSAISVNKDILDQTNFFFIIGRPRSGTTLIRTLFDAHPNVCIPLETRVIPNLYPKYGHLNKWTKTKLKSFYFDATRQLHFNNWTANREKLLADLLSMEGKASYADVVKVFYLNYISFFNKEQITLIGDKTPYNLHYLPILKSVFPEAKYINIIRDPHEHILSMKKVDFGSSNTAKLSYHWNLANKIVNKFKDKNQNNFKTVIFEEFLINPEIILKEWCSFLSIDYKKEVLNFYQAKDDVCDVYSKEKIEKHFKSLFQPIKPNAGKNWEDKMETEDKETTDYFSKEAENQYGYKSTSKANIVKRTFLFFQLTYFKLWTMINKVKYFFNFTVKGKIYKHIID